MRVAKFVQIFPRIPEYNKQPEPTVKQYNTKSEHI